MPDQKAPASAAAPSQSLTEMPVTIGQDRGDRSPDGPIKQPPQVKKLTLAAIIYLPWTADAFRSALFIEGRGITYLNEHQRALAAQAINVHDELVAALESALAWIEDETTGTAKGAEFKAAIKATLAKARG